ncbi:MAG: histidine phosphatase family protein [Sphingobium sp.]|jgi:phosphohistidine phosphatase|nr:MAG: histidine phosphatase family protein [Sphingobium sp.]
MKRLTLLRHAKSDWDDPVKRDFDRPLNRRGKRAALLIGQYARAKDMRFDHLVASPAVRVVETLETFIEGYGDRIETEWDRRIYLASAATLIDVIRDTPDRIDTLLLAGHNPGLEELILALVADDGSSPLRDEVEEKLPTASLAVIDLSVESWSDVDKGKATLTAFTRPRDLDPALGPEAR